MKKLFWPAKITNALWLYHFIFIENSVFKQLCPWMLENTSQIGSEHQRKGSAYCFVGPSDAVSLQRTFRNPFLNINMTANFLF